MDDLDYLAGGGLSARSGGDAPGRLLPGAVRARRGAGGVVALLGVGAPLSAVVFAGRLGDRVRDAAPGRSPPPAAAAVDPHRRGGAGRASPALVLERIANEEGVGCVKIDGEVWTARSYDEDEVIDAGERVEVVEIRGATALVMH